MEILVRNGNEKFIKYFQALFESIISHTNSKVSYKFKNSVDLEDIIAADFYITFTSDEYDAIPENKLTILDANDKITVTSGEIFVLSYKNNTTTKKQNQSDDVLADEIASSIDSISSENEEEFVVKKYNPINKLLITLRDIIAHDVPNFQRVRTQLIKSQEIEFYKLKFAMNACINNTDVSKLIKLFEELDAKITTFTPYKILNLYSTMKSVIVNRMNVPRYVIISGELRFNSIQEIECNNKKAER